MRSTYPEAGGRASEREGGRVARLASSRDPPHIVSVALAIDLRLRRRVSPPPPTAWILESISKRRNDSMVRKVARAGDGGAAAGGAARASWGVESQAKANGIVKVVAAKLAQAV